MAWQVWGVNINAFTFPGPYTYTSELLQLQARKPGSLQPLPPELYEVDSPLRRCWGAWARALATHPDQTFAQYILQGLLQGFRIGFDRACPLTPARRNSPSAWRHPEVVEQYLGKEISGGRMMGPYPAGAIRAMQVNRMAVIPKGHVPGRWRLITDLSFPPNASVNDGITPAVCSLQYTSVERVARAAQCLGKGALLAKLDVQAAYRLVPVHPEDRPLLGVRWGDSYYVDGMLPFGLRSAPKIFTALADALEWCVRRAGVTDVDHHLDDYITIGPPHDATCKENLAVILATCESLGVPLAAEKLEGPSTCLTFLGIEIDTSAGVLRLPAEKLVRIQEELLKWSKRRTWRRKQLESLIGLLQHACKVVRPGRSFLRRMINLLQHSHRPHHRIRLNRTFRADLLWWKTFIGQWNGVGVFPPPATTQVSFASDASGAWGCGAYCGPKWFQYRWPARARDNHITFLELLAVLLACAVWGREWQGRRVLCWCDNEAAVHVLASRSCRDRTLMHLLRCLFFLEATFRFGLRAKHIPGVHNQLADDLSRNQASAFLSKVPLASRRPSLIRPEIPQVLLDPSLDWTSPTWTQLFSCTLTRD